MAERGKGKKSKSSKSEEKGGSAEEPKLQSSDGDDSASENEDGSGRPTGLRRKEAGLIPATQIPPPEKKKRTFFHRVVNRSKSHSDLKSSRYARKQSMKRSRSLKDVKPEEEESAFADDIDGEDQKNGNDIMWDESIPLLVRVLTRQGHRGFQSIISKVDKKDRANVTDADGFSAMHFASLVGTRASLAQCIDKSQKKTLLKKDKNGMTALHYAAAKDNIENVTFLLESGAKPNVKDSENGDSPLHLAAAKGNALSTDALLRWAASPNTKNNLGVRPLHLAAQEGHLNIVKMLVDKKANVNAFDNNMITPLHRAAQNQHLDVAYLLLKNKANPNMVDIDNVTPLHLAVISGHPYLIQLLLNHKANPAVVTKTQRGILHIAAQHGRDIILKYFLKQHSSLLVQNLGDAAGFTPLHLAAMNGYKSCIIHLIQFKDVSDELGLQPLSWALLEGHPDCTEILLKAGAQLQFKANHYLRVLAPIEQDLGVWFRKRKYGDITFVVDKKKISAHRIICSRNKIFRELMDDNKEQEKVYVDNWDYGHEAFDALLEFVYAGKVEKLSPKLLKFLYAISKRYSFTTLKNSCKKFFNGDDVTLKSGACKMPLLAERKRLSYLGMHLEQFVDLATFHDIVFLIDGKRVYGHKVVVCSRCKYLAGLIAKMPKNQDELELSDMPLNVFLAILRYLYSGAVGDILQYLTFEDIVSLSAIAENYGISHIMTLTELSLYRHIATNNVTDIYRAAHATGRKILKYLCLDFISKFYDSVSKTDSYMAMPLVLGSEIKAYKKLDGKGNKTTLKGRPVVETFTTDEIRQYYTSIYNDPPPADEPKRNKKDKVK